MSIHLDDQTLLEVGAAAYMAAERAGKSIRECMLASHHAVIQAERLVTPGAVGWVYESSEDRARLTFTQDQHQAFLAQSFGRNVRAVFMNTGPAALVTEPNGIAHEADACAHQVEG